MSSTAILVCLPLCYGLFLVLYRLFFHPLSKFPGPKLAAASKWYEFYFDIIQRTGGQYMFEIERMHDRYGPIVRVTPDELHVRDSAWFDTLYQAGSAVRDKYPPSAIFAGTPLGVFGTIDHDTHRVRKAPLASYFSKRSIRSFGPGLQAHTEDFCQRLYQSHKKNETVNIRLSYLSYATDLVSIYAFNHTLGLQDSPSNAEAWLTTVKAIAAVSPFFKQFPNVVRWLIPCPVAIVKVLYPAFVPMLQLHRRMQREAQEARVTASVEENRVLPISKDLESRPTTVFDAILHSSVLPPKEKSQERLAQDGFIAIFGGGDPAARAMTNATYYILSNPSVLTRLRKELDAAMPNPLKLASMQTIDSLPYLTAAVKENLRLQAISTSRLEVVCPEETLKYGNWIIEPGTPVGMTLRDVLHDPKVFSEPGRFVPERWLDSEGRIDVSKDRYYVPFSRGHRMCLGYSFATTLIAMTLAAVFRRFEIELVDTVYERDIKIVRDCFIGETAADTKGVKIKILAERK